MYYDADIATNAGGITTNATAIGTPTAANTANEIVKRDGTGNFAAGTITANLIGDVTGNITGNITGNVTGNSDTATNFTGALAGDITGTQGATNIEEAALYGKTLQASFVPATGTVSVGDTLEAALEKTTANLTDTVNKTSTNASAITALDVTVGNLTTRVTAIETADTTQDGLIAANTAAAVAAQATADGAAAAAVAAQATADGAAAAVITAQTAADDAQADLDALSSIANVDIEGVTTFAVASGIVVLGDSDNITADSLTTITGASEGQRLIIFFDETITITNDDSATADTINILGAVDETYDAGDTLQLIYINGSWYQLSRSLN
jgi:trimeric autotransporter adhesin